MSDGCCAAPSTQEKFGDNNSDGVLSPWPQSSRCADFFSLVLFCRRHEPLRCHRYRFTASRTFHSGERRQAGRSDFHWGNWGWLVVQDCCNKRPPFATMSLILPQQGTVKLHTPILPQLQTTEIVEYGGFPPGKHFEAFFCQRLVTVCHVRDGAS